jgi:hypothetical protein
LFSQWSACGKWGIGVSQLKRLDIVRMNIEPELIENQVKSLSSTEHYVLMLYRFATYVAFNVIEDAAMLAFGLS